MGFRQGVERRGGGNIPHPSKNHVILLFEQGLDKAMTETTVSARNYEVQGLGFFDKQYAGAAKRSTY